MLNILVCVKQVPDVDLVTIGPGDRQSGARRRTLYAQPPLDGNALEAAVRVKERYGGAVPPS